MNVEDILDGMEIYKKAIRVFNNMKNRCYNKNKLDYKYYGGRGIFISDEWLNNPNNFYNWYLNNYFEDAQVDRIDNDGPYSISNCEMKSRTQNIRNRRITLTLSCWGETKPLAEWLEDSRTVPELRYATALKRISMGWEAEEVLTMKVDHSSSVKRKEKDKNGNYRGQMPDVAKINAFGESKTLHEWSIDPRCVVSKTTLHARLSEMKWAAEEAITKTAGKNAGIKIEGKSLLQWSKDPNCKVSYKVLSNRVKKGMSIQEAMQ